MERKIIKIIFSFLLFFDIVYADEIEVNSDKYILYNLNDNSILLEKDSKKETYIASLTKVMTVIVAIENIDNYEDKITIKSNMINDIAWDVSTTGFKTGDVVSYNDLLYAAILNSGADAVQALALSVSKTKSDFVKLMNDKVKELGLKNTHFSNVIGLTEDDNYSSAYDMAQILMYALKNKKFKEVFTTKSYDLSINKTVKSTISSYAKNTGYNLDYITGAKTGYTNASGYCLITTATFNNTDYLLVTLNAHSDTKSIHVKDTISIYDYYKENYDYHSYVDKNDIVVKLKTKDSKEEEINVKSGIEKSFYEKNTFSKKDISYEYKGVDSVSFFTIKGSKLGSVKIIYQDKVIDEFDVLYDGTLTFSLIEFLKNRYYILLIGVIFILITLKCLKK